MCKCAHQSDSIVLMGEHRSAPRWAMQFCFKKTHRFSDIFRTWLERWLAGSPIRHRGGRSSMHAYNLFRHREKQDLVCAVPEDCAVPGFIAREAWNFDRK